MPTPIELPTDLPRPLVALAWMLGRWEGTGVVGYPTLGPDRLFGQELEVSHDGRAFLRWESRTWELDEAGQLGAPLATETGFWRVPSGEAGPDGTEVELLLAHPTGYLEMFVGRAHAGKVEVATDVVARSPSAAEYSAANRLYGQVEGDLLWAMDVAAGGHPMRSHSSARLQKVSS